MYTQTPVHIVLNEQCYQRLYRGSVHPLSLNPSPRRLHRSGPSLCLHQKRGRPPRFGQLLPPPGSPSHRAQELHNLFTKSCCQGVVDMQRYAKVPALAARAQPLTEASTSGSGMAQAPPCTTTVKGARDILAHLSDGDHENPAAHRCNIAPHWILARKWGTRT